VKNLSCDQLWSLAFLQGKDDHNLIDANLRGMLKDFLKMRRFKGKDIIQLMPCDMSTHNSMTRALHMTCFRCLEHRNNFREIFEVINCKRTLEEVASERDCFVSDLRVINSGESVREFRLEAEANNGLIILEQTKKEAVLQQLTAGKNGVTALAPDTRSDQVLNRPLRVYKKYPLCDHRPSNCTATGLSDLQLPFCETHGIMRVSENLTNAMLFVMLNTGLAAKINKKLSDKKIKLVSLFLFFFSSSNM